MLYLLHSFTFSIFPDMDVSICPLTGKSHCKSGVWIKYPYPSVKLFYPDGCGLFQGNPAPIHRAGEHTEWLYIGHAGTCLVPLVPMKGN